RTVVFDLREEHLVFFDDLGVHHDSIVGQRLWSVFVWSRGDTFAGCLLVLHDLEIELLVSRAAVSFPDRHRIRPPHSSLNRWKPANHLCAALHSAITSSIPRGSSTAPCLRSAPGGDGAGVWCPFQDLHP